MTDDTLSGLMVLDWPEECTSHEFVEHDPPPGETIENNSRMTWYRCNRCGCYKLIKTARLSKHRPEDRIIWQTIPYHLTSTCCDHS